jgi:hypothetical protein
VSLFCPVQVNRCCISYVRVSLLFVDWKEIPPFSLSTHIKRNKEIMMLRSSLQYLLDFPQNCSNVYIVLKQRREDSWIDPAPFHHTSLYSLHLSCHSVPIYVAYHVANFAIAKMFGRDQGGWSISQKGGYPTTYGATSRDLNLSTLILLFMKFCWYFNCSLQSCSHWRYRVMP